MNDSFNFGRQARPRPRVTLDPRLLLGAVVLILAVFGAYAAMHLFASPGKQIARTERSVVSSADAARDSAAQSALSTTLQTAKLAYVDGGEDFTSAGTGQLSALDPSFTYTDGPSTDPSVVSLATTKTSWSAAVMSDSGTCFWIHDDVTVGTTTYGHGTPCTGAAAAGATGTSW
jgi:type II secretory pathway pseudopilin PulG